MNKAQLLDLYKSKKKPDDQNVTSGLNQQSALDVSNNLNFPLSQTAKKAQTDYKKEPMSPVLSIDSEGLHNLMAIQD